MEISVSDVVRWNIRWLNVTKKRILVTIINLENPLPYSTCFICKQRGHLVGQCPENERGIYPNGGCCKFCGSVRHLAKDCKPMEQEKGAIMLGTMDMNQGGDDDDVFDSIHKIQKETPAPKPVVKKQKKVVNF